MPFQRNAEEFLRQANSAIEGALTNPAILEALAPYGYTRDRIIQEGQALYNSASDSIQNQQEDRTDQLRATKTFNTLKDTFNQTYTRHLNLARVIFKNDSATASLLQLKGERGRTYAAWYKQVKQFYYSALNKPAIGDRLATLNIKQNDLKDAQQALTAVEAARVARDHQKGTAQAATQKRQAALEALQDWISDYTAVARIALAHDPQVLEGLGLLVRS